MNTTEHSKKAQYTTEQKLEIMRLRVQMQKIKSSNFAVKCALTTSIITGIVLPLITHFLK
jgi:hypothetical protein